MNQNIETKKKAFANSAKNYIAKGKTDLLPFVYTHTKGLFDTIVTPFYAKSQ